MFITHDDLSKLYQMFAYGMSVLFPALDKQWESEGVTVIGELSNLNRLEEMLNDIKRVHPCS